jgi:N-acetylglucosamine-6-phosphate deacetylase
MLTALFNGRVLTDNGFVQGQTVLVEHGQIKALVDDSDHLALTAPIRTDLGGQMLLPGFIDIQVNGGGGALFNDQPTVDAIRAIGAAHRRFGTTGFLPTVISDDLERIEMAMRAAAQAVDTVPGVLGVHVEGPFLNRERKGVHDASKFRLLDERAFQMLTTMRAGRIVTTLAPEITTPEMIGRLVKAGVIVSAGHTDGTYDVITEGLAHGVTGFTHLFNAMSPLNNRAPGAVGAALDNDDCWCGIIVDGHHVAPATLRIALKAKGPKKMMLITDAMAGVGLIDKSFRLQGRLITVRNGVCVDENGVLAGSDLDMASAVRNSVALLGVDLPTAVRMATSVPAAFLGLENTHGRIAPGFQADLVQASDSLDILESWIAGTPSGA